MRPHGLYPTRLLCPWDFPGRMWNWGPPNQHPSGLPSSDEPFGVRVCSAQFTDPLSQTQHPQGFPLLPSCSFLSPLFPTPHLLLPLAPEFSEPTPSPATRCLHHLLCTRPQICSRLPPASQQPPTSWLGLVCGSDPISAPESWSLLSQSQCPSSSVKGCLTWHQALEFSLFSHPKRQT